MVDAIQDAWGGDLARSTGKAAPARRSLARLVRRRSTTAFLMCLPLIAIVAGLILYPAFYAIFLSMLNKAQTRFVGLGNFSYLLSRDVFWMVVWPVRRIRYFSRILQSSDRLDHCPSHQ